MIEKNIFFKTKYFQPNFSYELSIFPIVPPIMEHPVTQIVQS